MIVRRIATEAKTLLLTFDDGPDAVTTPRVLETLQREQALATFFVVAKKAQADRALIEKILAGGHAIGNHSLDHGYRAFFGSQDRINDWIEESEQMFANLLVEPVGFRPPAGVVTPPLRKALLRKDMPLVLWQTRFFDTVFPWSKSKAESSLLEAQSGDIVLLHDRQRRSRIDGFCEALSHYIRTARQQGFYFKALTAKQLQDASL